MLGTPCPTLPFKYVKFENASWTIAMAAITIKTAIIVTIIIIIT
jgi:hypothetical protein